MAKEKVELQCCGCPRVFVRPKRLLSHIAKHHPEFVGVANPPAPPPAREAVAKRRRRQKRPSTATAEHVTNGPDPNKLYLVPIGEGSVSRAGRGGGTARREVIDLRSVSPVSAEEEEVVLQRAPALPRWQTINGQLGRLDQRRDIGKTTACEPARGTPVPSSHGAGSAGRRHHPYRRNERGNHLPTPRESSPPHVKHLAASRMEARVYDEEEDTCKERYDNNVYYDKDSNDAEDNHCKIPYRYSHKQRLDDPEADSDAESADSGIDLDAMSIPDVLGRSVSPSFSVPGTPAKRAYTVEDSDEEEEDERVRWKRPRWEPEEDHVSEDEASARSTVSAGAHVSSSPTSHNKESTPPTSPQSRAPSRAASVQPSERESSVESEHPSETDDAAAAAPAKRNLSKSTTGTSSPQPQHLYHADAPPREDSFQRFIDHAVALPNQTTKHKTSSLRSRDARAARVSTALDDEPVTPPAASALPMTRHRPHVEADTDDGHATPRSEAATDAAAETKTTGQSVAPDAATSHSPVEHHSPGPSKPRSEGITPASEANPIEPPAIPATPVTQPPLAEPQHMVSAATQTETPFPVVPAASSAPLAVPAPTATATVAGEGGLARRNAPGPPITTHPLHRCDAAACGFCHPLAHALHSLHGALAWFSWKCEE